MNKLEQAKYQRELSENAIYWMKRAERSEIAHAAAEQARDVALQEVERLRKVIGSLGNDTEG